MNNLIGLKIRLDRPIDRDRPCCRNICIIGPGKGPHAGTLSCADCGQQRGRLSKPTAQWIELVASRFGAPLTPIVVRKAHTFEEEEAGQRKLLNPKPNINSRFDMKGYDYART
jgi:hypothetical protein